MRVNLSGKLLSCFYAVILFISFMDAAVYLTMRPFWFFINKTVGGKIPWAVLFFILFLAFFLYTLVLFIQNIKRPNDNLNHPVLLNVILPVVFAVLFSSIDIYIYNMLGNSQSIVLRNLIGFLPWILISLIIVFFVIIYPGLRVSGGRLFKYTAASVLMLLVFIYSTGLGRVKITSGPFIQLVDDSNLAVMWTTNRNSTAYVEYGIDENNLKRVFSSRNGIIDANTAIHKVIVPAGEGSQFIYRVGSTGINSYLPYSVEYGNTVVSGFKRYNDFRSKDRISFYVLNDVHEDISIYKKFLSGNDYDFVVSNGDSVNWAESRDAIIDKVLNPISQFTNGEKPLLFIRGNHETRGAYASNLIDLLALPQDRYYYTFSFGPVYCVVLDSGEDKPDNHEEYSGLADFERYRQDETAWLKEIAQSGEYKNAMYKIAFVHIPLNSYEGQEDAASLKACQQDWRQILNDMQIDAVFSGHTHVPEIIEADNIFSFPTFIGGGEYGLEDDYTAVKVEITKESMKIYYITYDGRITNQYEIKRGA